MALLRRDEPVAAAEPEETPVSPTAARDALAAADRKIADAKGRVAAILARATAGEDVDPAELGTARAAVELAELPRPALQAAADKESEAERHTQLMAAHAAATEAESEARNDACLAIRGLAAAVEAAYAAAGRQHAAALAVNDVVRQGVSAGVWGRRAVPPKVDVDPWVRYLVRSAHGDSHAYMDLAGVTPSADQVNAAERG